MHMRWIRQGTLDKGNLFRRKLWMNSWEYYIQFSSFRSGPVPNDPSRDIPDQSKSVKASPTKIQNIWQKSFKISPITHYGDNIHLNTLRITENSSSLKNSNEAKQLNFQKSFSIPIPIAPEPAKEVDESLLLSPPSPNIILKSIPIQEILRILCEAATVSKIALRQTLIEIFREAHISSDDFKFICRFVFSRQPDKLICNVLLSFALLRCQWSATELFLYKTMQSLHIKGDNVTLNIALRSATRRNYARRIRSLIYYATPGMKRQVLLDEIFRNYPDPKPIPTPPQSIFIGIPLNSRGFAIVLRWLLHYRKDINLDGILSKLPKECHTLHVMNEIVSYLLSRKRYTEVFRYLDPSKANEQTVYKVFKYSRRQRERLRAIMWLREIGTDIVLTLSICYRLLLAFVKDHSEESPKHLKEMFKEVWEVTMEISGGELDDRFLYIQALAKRRGWNIIS